MFTVIKLLIILIVLLYLIISVIKFVRQRKNKIIYYTEDEDEVDKITDAIQDAINDINKGLG